MVVFMVCFVQPCANRGGKGGFSAAWNAGDGNEEALRTIALLELLYRSKVSLDDHMDLDRSLSDQKSDQRGVEHEIP